MAGRADRAETKGKSIHIKPQDLCWDGAMGLEQHVEGVQPWRVRVEDRELFHPELLAMAACPSGVRIVFSSDGTSVSLSAIRLVPHYAYDYDLRVNGVLVDTIRTPPEEPLTGVTLATYREELKRRSGRRGTEHTITLRLKSAPSMEVLQCELYLSNMGPQIVTGFSVSEATVFMTTAPTRPKHLVHGSSITHAATRGNYVHISKPRPAMLDHGSSITHSIGFDSALPDVSPAFPVGSGSAWSPSRTWPATAARLANIDYISLGFAGQAVLDPPVARMIRDTPGLDCITLKLGINVHNHGSMSLRSFGQAALGFIQTVRDGHRNVPLLIVSPIYGAWRETITYSETPLAPNRDNADPRFPTLPQMRTELKKIVDMLRSRGDTEIHYVSGLQLFTEADMKAGLAPDSLHPNGDGYELMGQRFAKIAFGPKGHLLPGRLKHSAEAKL